jgi:hypothetical protein
MPETTTARRFAVTLALLLGVASAAFAGEPESLDMHSLETRLRETRAIDPVSKLRLKGQIDELVGQFREAHERGQPDRVGGLRQPYDRMLVRIQSMLERDPVLAGDIVASREPLWRVLSDPAKFRRQVTADAR